MERKVCNFCQKLFFCLRHYYRLIPLYYFQCRDKKHVDWVRSWSDLLSELQKFVKQYHTTGLVWSGTKSAGVPPPPPGGMPPPPPPLIDDLNDLSVGDKSDDRSALFAAINQGENITRSNYVLSFSSYKIYYYVLIEGVFHETCRKTCFYSS